MKNVPPIGTSLETTRTVGPEDVITFATAGGPGVLSTPRLIDWIERTAREALQPFLETGESSVGAAIELRHLTPSPQGAQVTVLARVIRVDGRAVCFQVEARDAGELIARGLHERVVIRVDRFRQRVEGKKSQSSPTG